MDRRVLNCDINSIAEQKERSAVVNSVEGKYSEVHQQNKLQSPIFKLNIDCLKKIFDYLPFDDVHSIGETCKPMQQIAGEFFQANHVTVAYVSHRNISTINTYYDYLTKVDVFNKFQQNLCFENVSPSRSLEKVTRYVARNYKQEFKRMRFRKADLTGAEIRNLSDKFEKVESASFEWCFVNRKFYKRFPKLCENLRRLYLEDFNCDRNVMRRIGNEWLLWTYPKLEHLHWMRSHQWQRIDELKVFFEQNPQVRSFAIDINSLWINRHLFTESAISLDDLTVELYWYDRFKDLVGFYSYLKELYEKGVYKRLHIKLTFRQRMLDEMLPLDALRSLCFNYLSGGRENIILPKWADLYELKIDSECHLGNCDTLVHQLVNLRRAHFKYIKLKDLLQFVRHSVHLTKMKIREFSDDSESYTLDFAVLDVAALNMEREKLEGAKKMVIYIREQSYLPTKWKMNGMEYSLIEIRRVSSDEWGHHFGPGLDESK